MRWDKEKYEAYMVKFNKDLLPYPEEEADPGPESKLQGKIVKWANDKGYPIISFRQSKNARGFIKKGLPDITLALPAKRTVWIELKSDKGILKEEQKQTALKLMALGHEWYQVRSYKRFLDIVEDK